MTNFAQALARIEERIVLTKKAEGCWEQEALRDLLEEHADSIVQLGKVAEEMRGIAEDAPFRLRLADNYALAMRLEDAAEAYDKLMKGE